MKLYEATSRVNKYANYTDEQLILMYRRAKYRHRVLKDAVDQVLAPDGPDKHWWGEKTAKHFSAEELDRLHNGAVITTDNVSFMFDRTTAAYISFPISNENPLLDRFKRLMDRYGPAYDLYHELMKAVDDRGIDVSQIK